MIQIEGSGRFYPAKWKSMHCIEYSMIDVFTYIRSHFFFLSFQVITIMCYSRPVIQKKNGWAVGPRQFLSNQFQTSVITSIFNTVQRDLVFM